MSQPCVGVPQFGLDQGSFIPVHQDPQGFQGGQQNPPIDVFAKSEKYQLHKSANG